MNKKLLTIVGLAAFVGIGYYLWKSSKPKDTASNETILDGKYPKQIDVSKIKTVSSGKMTYDKYSVFMDTNDKNQGVIILNNGSEGGGSAMYDITTGMSIGTSYNERGQTKFIYFDPTSEDTSTPPPQPSTPLPARLLSKTCAADEVEEAIPCLIAPCPSMCVKKKGFVGGTGSFFNPIRGRSQDTSF